MPKKQKLVGLIALITLICAGLCSCAMIAMLYGNKELRNTIGLKHETIEKLQKRLISAQITTSRLDQVQKLIQENMALSDADTLTQGASIQFLNALTEVLDQLAITLIQLEPLKPETSGKFVETPYKMTIACTYEQLCKLQNKMEKYI